MPLLSYLDGSCRQLQQYPIAEIAQLRGDAAYDKTGVSVETSLDLGLASGVAKQSEVPTGILHSVV